jgi:uncharacterized protein (TIGR03437 family)
MLRLASTTVGPVSIATGTAGPTQVVEAYNAGDGSLNLTATPTDPATGKTPTPAWLSASVGSQRGCTTTTQASACIPISISLNTASLPAGTATAIVTVTDPNAADAPQTITVVVAMGGTIPNSVAGYVAPGGVYDSLINTNSSLRATATTQDRNNWLTLVYNGVGSFGFNFPYKIELAPQPANVPGTYTGSLAISGSNFTGDNKTVAVTMNVTTSPIAQGPTGPINIRQAQGAAPFSPASFNAVPLTVASVGQQPLVFGTPTVSSGASWLTATSNGAGASLSVDSTGANLAPGNYSATVTVPSNAINGSVVVPVNLVVIPKGPAVIAFQGVQDNATFIPGDPLTPGDVAVVKGEQLSLSAYKSGPAPPLATQVADTSVLVNGTPAPIFYTLYGQIAFQVPTTIPIGNALVQVKRTDGSISNQASVAIAPRAPRLLLLSGDYGAIVNADGCRGITPCVLGGSLPFPSSFSQPGYPAYPARAGDVLTLYAIGLGPTNPSVPTGQPAPTAEPFARLVTTPLVRFGDNPLSPTVTPLFAALSPGFAGLYQVNVQVPDGLPSGNIGVSVAFPDATSNQVLIAVQ